MAKKISMGATLSLKDGNFFTNMKSAVSASDNLKDKLSGATKGVKSFGDSTSKSNKILSSAVKTVAGAAAAYVSLRSAVDFGKSVVEIGSAYQDSVAKVSTIADTTVKSISQLSAETVALSNKTGVAAADINESLYQAISAGADTAHATDLVAVAIKAAKGGFTDTTTAVDGLTSVLNTYGMATSDAESLANQFLITQNKGKTSFGELATTIGQVAPVAKSTGVRIDELLSGVASLTANGLSTSSAMTGLKAALSNIIKPTADAQKTAKSLGLDFSTTAIKTKGLSGFMKELQKKTGGNTDTMAKLFGSVEGLNAMLTLTSDGGMKLMTDTMQEMKTNTTALEDAYGAMTNTVSAQTDIFKTKLDNMKINIFERLDGSKFVDVIKMASSAVEKMTPAVENVVVAIGDKLFDAINIVHGVAKDTFSDIKSTLEKCRPSIDSMKEAFEGVGESLNNAFGGDGGNIIVSIANTAIPMLVSALTAAANTIKFATDRWSFFKPVLKGVLVNFLGYKAISGTGGTIKKVSGSVTKFIAAFGGISKVTTVFGDMIDLFKASGGGLKQIPTLFGDIGKGLKGISGAGSIVKGLGSAFTFLGNPIGLIVVGIGAAVAIGIVLYKNWDKIKGAAKALGNAIKTVFNGIKDKVSGAWNSVKEKTSAVWNGATSTVSDKVGSIKDAVSEKLSPIVDAVKDRLSGIKDKFSEAFSGAIDFVKKSYNEGALKPIVDKVTNAFGTLKDKIGEKLAPVKEVMGKAFEGAKTIVAGKLNNIKTAYEEHGGGLKGAAAAAMTAVKECYKTGYDAINALTGGRLGKVVDTIKQKLAPVISIISTAFNGVKSAVMPIITAVKDYVVNTFNNIRSTIGNIISRIIDTIKNGVQTIKDGFSTAFEGAKQIVLNVWNAIKSYAQLAFDNVRTVVTNAITGVKTQIENVQTTVSTAFNSVKTTVSSTFDSIKTKVTSVFETVKTTVKNAVDKIKGMFNFTWELPKIKLPHFSISPASWKIGDLLKGSIPKLNIEWYANGGIMTRPTLFGMNGNNAMVGGEAGPEAVLPLAQFWNNLERFIDRSTQNGGRPNITNNVYVTVEGGDMEDESLANTVAKRIIDVLENM